MCHTGLKSNVAISMGRVEGVRETNPTLFKRPWLLTLLKKLHFSQRYQSPLDLFHSSVYVHIVSATSSLLNQHPFHLPVWLCFSAPQFLPILCSSVSFNSELPTTNFPGTFNLFNCLKPKCVLLLLLLPHTFICLSGQ